LSFHPNHILAVYDNYISHVTECLLLITEEYHTQNGNVDQYVTLQQFKGCNIAQLLLSENAVMANVELTDYYVLLAASHTGM